MEIRKIVQEVIEAIQIVQERSGCTELTRMTGATIPIGGVAEFDSLRSLEVIIEIEARLGVQVADPVNIFADDSWDKPLSILEIAERLSVLIRSKEGD